MNEELDESCDFKVLSKDHAAARKGCKIHIEKDTQEREPCKATGRKGEKKKREGTHSIISRKKKVNQFDDKMVRSDKSYLQQLP